MVQGVTTNVNEWYNEWQRVVQQMTTSDNEWQRVVQRVTTKDKEWNVWQRVITNDSQWQRMTGSGTTNENQWEQMKWVDFKFQNETKGQFGSRRTLFKTFRQHITTIYSAILIICKSGNWWHIFNIIFRVLIIQVFLHFFRH